MQQRAHRGKSATRDLARALFERIQDRVHCIHAKISAEQRLFHALEVFGCQRSLAAQ